MLTLAKPTLAQIGVSVYKMKKQSMEEQTPEGLGKRRVVSPEGWGGPKFRVFFFPLPPPFSIFFCLSGCLLVEFWWCF